MALFVFIIVTFAVFIIPPLSAFLPGYPDTLRPESIFLFLFFVVRIISSGKLVKVTLEFFFLMAICFMALSIAWAASGLGIRIVPQDFVDIYSFLIYWAVFRYGYEMAYRYRESFTNTVTVVFFIVVVMQFAIVLGQRMNVSEIVNISSWWSHDYDASPWLRITRPHGMTANAITLSILMVLYISYFSGQVLSILNSKICIWLSWAGLLLCALIIILTKSRSGFALLFLVPAIFLLFGKESFYKIITSCLKMFCFGIFAIVIFFGAARVSGYRGQFVLVTAATELVGRIGNFVREGVHEKEGAVGRIKDAKIAFSQMKESPYIGIGPAQSRGRSWFHSSYVTLLRRYGVIGMFAYLMPYCFVLMQSGKYVSCSGASTMLPLVTVCLALLMLTGGVTNYTFIGEWQMNYFFWLIAGIVIALQHVMSDTKNCHI